MLGLAKNIHCPVRLLHGGQDRICPLPAAELLTEAIPSAELTVWPEAGHAPFLARVVALDKQAIRRRFERAAASYDAFSPMQREMAARLVEAIGGEPRSILELGCGTGYLTALLRERFRDAAIEAVDFSAAMIARAKEHVPEVRYFTCDIEELALERESYDLIVSSATVQWLTAPELTIANLADLLNEKGALHLTTFGPRTFWELDEILAELGCERGLTLLPARKWETLLVGAGLHRVRAQTCEERFSYPDCAAFLRSVKSSGAGYAPHVLAPGTLMAAMRRYDERFFDGAGVSATYDVVTLSAER